MKLCGSLNIIWHCSSLKLKWKLTFPVLWPLLCFPNLLAYWMQHFNSIIFSSAEIPSFEPLQNLPGLEWCIFTSLKVLYGTPFLYEPWWWNDRQRMPISGEKNEFSKIVFWFYLFHLYHISLVHCIQHFEMKSDDKGTHTLSHIGFQTASHWACVFIKQSTTVPTGKTD